MAGARRFRPRGRDDVPGFGFTRPFADSGPIDSGDILFGRHARGTFGWRELEGAPPLYICFARFRRGTHPTIIRSFFLGATTDKNYRDAHSHLVRNISPCFSRSHKSSLGAHEDGSCS